MWQYMDNNDFNWEPKSVMGRAESALKRDFAEERLVLDIVVRCMRLGNRKKKQIPCTVPFFFRCVFSRGE